MPNTITFEDAKREGIILPGHYFAITVPEDRVVTANEKETGVKGIQKFIVEAGQRQLWRLNEELILQGKPTKEDLVLRGWNGILRAPNTMHRIIRELYDIPGVFEMARACSLPEKAYFFTSTQEAYEEVKKYERTADHLEWYWLASHCFIINDTDVDVALFYMNCGEVYCDNVAYESGDPCDDGAFAICPEGTPKSNLLLDRSSGDGSKKRPWICLNK